VQLLEALRLALDTLRVQKLKSFFTLLGVCIGVMFLIAVVSIVDGMGRYMEEDLVGKLIGINTFELRHRPNINIGDVDASVWEEYRRRPRILESDVEPVVEALPDGSRWAMYAEDNLRIESAYSRPRNGHVFAVDGDWFEIKKLDVTSGRRFTQQEVLLGDDVVILGPELVKRLFPTLDPIGRPVKIGGLPYQVVGVGESLGSAFGISFDNYVVAPLPDARSHRPAGEDRRSAVPGRRGRRVAGERVRNLVRQLRRRALPGTAPPPAQPAAEGH